MHLPLQIPENINMSYTLQSAQSTHRMVSNILNQSTEGRHLSSDCKTTLGKLTKANQDLGESIKKYDDMKSSNSLMKLFTINSRHTARICLDMDKSSINLLLKLFVMQGGLN